MVRERVGLLGLLRKQTTEADLDFLREAVTVLAAALMDAEVSAQIGAEYGERTRARSTQRNGYRTTSRSSIRRASASRCGRYART